MSDWTEGRMLACIARTFSQSTQGDGRRYAVAYHVNNGAGFNYGRTLDAIVMDTWPSKGLLLHGIEVKVSKADLRMELGDTRKAGAFLPYLDTFSIAAGPECGTQTELLATIPPQWGVYAPDSSGERLRTIRKPLMLHADTERHQVFDRSLMAAFARALLQRSESAAELAAVKEATVAEVEKRMNAQFSLKLRDAEALQSAVKQFEETSGVRLGTWGDEPKRIGEAVNFVLMGGLQVSQYRRDGLRALAKELTNAAKSLDEFAISEDAR